MSFGSETGRTRSSMKGSSSKEKRQKRKKDEFHSHKKLHLQDAGPLDLEQVKARTILAFDKLGHQVLSSEPGGYNLQSWMKSFNSLLDDFQQKIGPNRLPTEFDARRRDINASLNTPPDSSEIDSEIEKLLKERWDARKMIEEETSKATARLNSLREERRKCEEDLKQERKNLAEMNEAKQSRQFFSRLLRAGPSTEQSEARIEELGSNLSKIEAEIGQLQKVRAATASGSSAKDDSATLEARQKVDSLQKRLDDLQLARQTKSQLVREREIATKTMSEIVSQIQLGNRGTEA